jgi:lysophospholipase L1-like esterase
LALRARCRFAALYPFKLQTMLTERYSAQTIQVFNSGFAGRLASEDRSRLDDALSDAQPQVLLLMEGANDLNAPFADGEGVNARVTATMGAMEDMVRDAVRLGVHVMLATLPPQRAGGTPNRGGAAAFLTRYNDALKDMAAKKGAEIVDMYAQFPISLIGEDGLHPTEAGYERMAAIWLEALKARYEKPPESTAVSAARAEHAHAGSRALAHAAPAGLPRY